MADSIALTGEENDRGGDTEAALIASARISRSSRPRACQERSGVGREDRYSAAGSATSMHPFSSTERSIPRLFAAHQRRRRRLRGRRRRLRVFVPAETVSSCHLSVLRFHSRERSLRFIFFRAREDDGMDHDRCQSARERRRRYGEERETEREGSRKPVLLAGIFILLLENAGMDAPAARIISRVSR